MTSPVGLLGSPIEYLGLKGLMVDTAPRLPAMAFVAFQAVFAIITVALISGAIADRAKFGTWMIFAGIWATIVYFPVAHWVSTSTARDVVTHGRLDRQQPRARSTSPVAPRCTSTPASRAWRSRSCSASGIGWPADPMRPHNLTLVMLGAGLLWFGWFGFNAGSALAAGNTASVVWVNTMVATGAASLGWLFDRADPRRACHLARRRLRRRRRSRRHHAVVFLGHAGRRDHRRCARRRVLRPGRSD